MKKTLVIMGTHWKGLRDFDTMTKYKNASRVVFCKIDWRLVS